MGVVLIVGPCVLLSGGPWGAGVTRAATAFKASDTQSRRVSSLTSERIHHITDKPFERLVLHELLVDLCVVL